MQFRKPPLAVSAQVQLLKDRGMLFADERRAVRVLQNINYYRLRAYWLPFEVPEAVRPQAAEHHFLGDLAGGPHDRLEHVQGGGADVPEDDPQGHEHARPGQSLVLVVVQRHGEGFERWLPAKKGANVW